MKIENIDINKIKKYPRNCKIHTDKQIEQIKNSILKFGNNDPIVIDDKNFIVEGHGRYEALKRLGKNEVPIIRLSHLTEKELNDYRIVHNKLTMDTDFDEDVLIKELNDINIELPDFDFLEIGIDFCEKEKKEETENKETLIICPICDYKGRESDFQEVYETEKVDNYEVKNAEIDDIDKIKIIAGKNSKQLGFVLRPALEESCNKGNLLVGKKNKKVLGFCNYNTRKDGYNVIYEICVDYKYRGNGIAKALIDKLPRPIRLKCPIDNESNKFYERIGFTLIDVEEGKKRKLNVWELG